MMRAQPASTSLSIAERWRQVRERVAAAADRAGRSADDVTIVAVSKKVEAARIAEGVVAGVSDLGENWIQEAREKIPRLDQLSPPRGDRQAPRWHFVGHLQRNKVKYIFDLFWMVHSVDSLDLAREIDRRAATKGQSMPILLEVNISGETTKYGLPIAQAAEVAGKVGSLEHVDLRGLMTVPPLSESSEASRPIYRRLRDLARAIETQKLPGVGMDDLSMGMTNDFEVAVEEGATLLRIGTAIFGPRPQRPAATSIVDDAVS